MRETDRDGVLMHLKEIPLKWLKRLFSDMHSAIVSTIVVSVVAGGGVYYLAENAWNATIEILQTPTPLWATITLLAAVSLLVKTTISRAYNSPKQSAFLFEDGDFKWKVTVKSNGGFSVDDVPYCKYHDLRFTPTPAGQYMCPQVVGSQCTSRFVNSDDLPLMFSMANSKAESIVSKYETKI